VVRLYEGAAPGSEGEHPPEVSDGRRIRNVSVPTLTIFRPSGRLTSDGAVIIAPGGGFVRLSIVNEGYDVATRLAEAGITAIVLKYRVDETVLPGAGATTSPAPPPDQFDPVAFAKQVDARHDTPGARQAMQDGASAVRLVRAHAVDWHIAADHVGFIGFSAGAAIAMHLALLADPLARPDFVAALYGSMPFGASVPAQAPPLFLAVAVDDSTVGPAGSLPIFDAWRRAGRDVELHIFQSGGHGFGMSRQNKTSDHWIDDYLWWLAARGLLAAP
jgi:acetyl esterase/lipase